MIIWLASYPRSGNTYLRTMLKCCFGIETYSTYDDLHDIAADEKTGAVVGHLSHGKDRNDFLAYAKKDKQQFFIKTHELPSDDCRAIYIIREGLATCVSYKNYLNNYSEPKEMTDVIVGDVDFGDWGSHVRTWLHRPENTLYINYESLTSDLDATIDKISKFIGRPAQNRVVPSFDELQTINPRFFHTGSNQRNIQEVDPADKLLFEVIHGKLNQDLGYQPHFELPENFRDMSSRLATYLHSMHIKQEVLSQTNQMLASDNTQLRHWAETAEARIVQEQGNTLQARDWAERTEQLLSQERETSTQLRHWAETAEARIVQEQDNTLQARERLTIIEAEISHLKAFAQKVRWLYVIYLKLNGEIRSNEG